MKNITAHQGEDGQWYINISNAKNGKTIGDGSEGYVSKANAVRALKHNWRDAYAFKSLKETPTSITFRMVPHVRPALR